MATVRDNSLPAKLRKTIEHYLQNHRGLIVAAYPQTDAYNLSRAVLRVIRNHKKVN